MNYENEVRKRWGNTEAFREFERRVPSDDAAQGLLKIFERFGELKNLPPENDSVQTEVANLQQYITDNFYTCTDEILSGLGQMYSADERFRKNIDGAGGDGTAVFASEAISVYCAK